MRRVTAAGVAFAASLAAAVGPASQASAQTPSDDPAIRCGVAEEHSYAGGSRRVVRDATRGIPFLVLLPRGYERSARRYPVVYLLQGGVNDVDCFLGKTDLIDFTGRQPDSRQAVVVLPDVLSGPAWRGPARRPAQETAMLAGLLPYVERRYAVRRGRAHRSIAGFSAGGLGALHLAARHPDTFAAVASLSGIAEVNENDPTLVSLGALGDLAQAPDDPAGDFTWGNPATDAVGWHNSNPIDLAPNYGGVSVALFSGDGRPCDQQDVGVDPTVNFWPPGFWVGESEILRWTTRFSDALEQARVRHTLSTGCGIHSYRYVERFIHAWWGPMFRAFGRPPPRSFDYNRVDPNFSVWGWSFKADPRRAAEFLYITDASRSGLTLKGSGTETVTTARLFRSRQRVRVTGAGYPAKVISADARGRLGFTVNLGPPHRQQQYTVAQRLEEARGGYWTTRAVRFTPLRTSGGGGNGGRPPGFTG